MGKRKGFKQSKHPVDALVNAVSSDEDDQVESKLEELLDEEIDKYNSTREKAPLKKVKGKNRPRADSDSDDEQEVYGFDLSSEDDEEEEALSDDGAKEQDSFSEADDDDDDEDILGEADHGIPDSRAWGSKSRIYHNTDYVDQDFGGFEGEDAEMAEQEETEAKEIQKRLTAELDEDDFLGFMPTKPEKIKKSGNKEMLKLDFDKLSLQEKRKLVQRECPEVIYMLDEYKDKMEVARVALENIESENSPFLKEFYKTKYHTTLNYCINISYYLYLRSTQPTSCKGHPVVQRILQFRRLMDELGEFNPAKYVDPPKKKVKFSTGVGLIKPPRKLAVGDHKDGTIQDKLLKPLELEDVNDELGEKPPEKRRITYEMAKNKGLTPRRKKEQRNPRVKHKEKFRKAKIRRKGQVRTPRTETIRYGGEMTGIKSHLTKSIKLK